MANNPYVNKVQKADGTTIIDISDTTATASDVASGKYFYTADGAKTQGTSSGGGGTVTITDTTDTHGGTIRTITTDPNATTVVALNATANDTYTAPSGYAYSPVVVNVAGGGSSYTLLGSAEFTVSTTSTSEIEVGTITCEPSAWTGDKYIIVTVEDKAGPRVGYFLSSSNLAYVNASAKTGSTATNSILLPNTGGIRYTSSGFSSFATNLSSYGVYGKSVYRTSGNILICAKYSSSYSGTIDGTYACKVWALDFPTGFSPWGD